jgi:glycerol-3-phosphate acyltransferase PlsY
VKAAPWSVLPALLVYAVVLASFRYAFLASITATVVMPVVAFFLEKPTSSGNSIPVRYFLPDCS